MGRVNKDNRLMVRRRYGRLITLLFSDTILQTARTVSSSYCACDLTHHHTQRPNTTKEELLKLLFSYPYPLLLFIFILKSPSIVS